MISGSFTFDTELNYRTSPFYAGQYYIWRRDIIHKWKYIIPSDMESIGVSGIRWLFSLLVKKLATRGRCKSREKKEISKRYRSSSDYIRHTYFDIHTS